MEFLIKTLKTLRPEGFSSETAGSVGEEIIKLIDALVTEFDFELVILKIKGLPELINCLNPASARKCCINHLLPLLTRDLMKKESSYENVIRLFSCITRRDLVQLLDGTEDLTSLKLVTEDLSRFSEDIIDHLSEDKFIESFFKYIDSSSSCLNLFLLPDLLERTTFPSTLSKQAINSILCNTSTVLSQRFDLKNEADNELKWIEPEFTKLMAVKLNLRVIEVIEERGENSYEFYTEVKCFIV